MPIFAIEAFYGGLRYIIRLDEMKQVVQQRRNPTWDLHERTVPTRFFLLAHKRTEHAVALGSAGRLYGWKYAKYRGTQGTSLTKNPTKKSYKKKLHKKPTKKTTKICKFAMEYNSVRAPHLHNVYTCYGMYWYNVRCGLYPLYGAIHAGNHTKKSYEEILRRNPTKKS